MVEAIWFRFTDFTMHTKKCGVQRGRNRRKDLGLELVNWRTDGSYCGRLLFKIILKVFFFYLRRKQVLKEVYSIDSVRKAEGKVCSSEGPTQAPVH